MKTCADTTGSTVVGCLTDIVPWEADLILTVRLWMHGPSCQAEVWNGYARAFGSRDGHVEMRHLESLMTALRDHARRPLICHGLACLCIGSDEAVLQTLVREAARGDLAEASMIAGLVVRACHAEQIALMSAQVGHAIQRMPRGAPGPVKKVQQTGETLH